MYYVYHKHLVWVSVKRKEFADFSSNHSRCDFFFSISLAATHTHIHTCLLIGFVQLLCANTPKQKAQIDIGTH